MTGNARPHSRTVWRRALTVLAIAAGGLALVLGVMAFTVWSPAAGVVLEAETAELTTFPPLGPLAPPASELSATEPSSTTSTTVAAVSRTLPPPRIPPEELRIEDLGVTASVRPVGLDEAGAMEIPEVSEIGWYLHGAVPGHPGATVLAAHVWWNGTNGPFRRLGALEPGAVVEVGLEDGTVQPYVVVKRTMYDKDALPSDLWRNSGPETLVLITCGGRFDDDSRRFEQNIVVYAVPSSDVTELQL
jgi:hypothetical protein